MLMNTLIFLGMQIKIKFQENKTAKSLWTFSDLDF